MSIDTSRALVPFNGLVPPVIGTERKEIDHYEGRDRPMTRTVFSGSRSDRMTRLYGRHGREYRDGPGRGENIDMYV